jgi:hypothetical protein
MVAIARLGDGGLWIGAALDATLLVIGLWRAFAGWPVHPSHGRRWHAAALLVGFSFLAYVAVAAASWPWHRTWGSTREEIGLALPGDPADRDPALEIQHAITIAAPPDKVWPWLVQIGQDRAGFYSYDWLERAVGADVHNTLEIRPQWQTRQVGDFVRATQPNYLGGLLGEELGWRVRTLEPQRALVLEHWGAFVLLPTDDGQTRFIIRSKMSDRTIAAWASALHFMTFDLPHFVMERRMMLTIKALAEREHERVASTTARR